jgi:hypothetical protein
LETFFKSSCYQAELTFFNFVTGKCFVSVEEVITTLERGYGGDSSDALKIFDSDHDVVEELSFSRNLPKLKLL